MCCFGIFFWPRCRRLREGPNNYFGGGTTFYSFSSLLRNSGANNPSSFFFFCSPNNLLACVRKEKRGRAGRLRVIFLPLPPLESYLSDTFCISVLCERYQSISLSFFFLWGEPVDRAETRLDVSRLSALFVCVRVLSAFAFCSSHKKNTVGAILCAKGVVVFVFLLLLFFSFFQYSSTSSFCVILVNVSTFLFLFYLSLPKPIESPSRVLVELNEM